MPSAVTERPPCVDHYKLLSGVQFIEQMLGFFQITRVKPLREPLVNRSQQFSRLARLALVAPEACEAHCGAKFPRFGMLLACDGERMLKIALRLRAIGNWQSAGNFTGNSACLSLTPSLFVVSIVVITSSMQRDASSHRPS
jgi:hypothetical protein